MATRAGSSSTLLTLPLAARAASASQRVEYPFDVPSSSTRGALRAHEQREQRAGGRLEVAQALQPVGLAGVVGDAEGVQLVE
jgi:hypothetical protein